MTWRKRQMLRKVENRYHFKYINTYYKTRLCKPAFIFEFFLLFFSINWSYGWSRFNAASSLHSQPPPPYQPPQYSIHATPTYVLKAQSQTLHILQNNTREVSFWVFFSKVDFNIFPIHFQQSMSPGSVTGMSPSYNSEPSPDYSMLVNQQRLNPRPPSNSPPLTPNSQSITSHIGSE